MPSPTITKQVAKGSLLVLFTTGAAFLWFVMGPVQVATSWPDDAWWIVGGPYFTRGPGWEPGLWLYIGMPTLLQLGLWSVHFLAAWRLWRCGLARRPWIVTLVPAVLGQGLLILGAPA